MAKQQRRFEPTVASVRVLLAQQYAASRRLEVGIRFWGISLNLKWVTSTMLFESESLRVSAIA